MKAYRTLKLLNRNEIDTIHNASLDILEKVGMKVPNETCLRLFADAGADVDYKTQVVKAPSSLIVECVKKIPKRYEVRPYDRKKAMTVNDGKLKGGMTVQYFINDYFKKERREGTTDDVLRAIAVGDSDDMDHISHVTDFVYPCDEPLPVRDIYGWKLGWTYAKKPIFAVYMFSINSVRYILEMAKVVAGGEEELRQRKIIDYNLESTSPLSFSSHALEICLEFSRYNLPLSNSPMVMAGASGPVTLAGSLALCNAEVLMAAALIYLMNPNIPYGYAGIPYIMDMRTTLCSFGAPEQVLFSLARIQLARYYGFAAKAEVGANDPVLEDIDPGDSSLPDFQGGFEKGVRSAMALAAGAESVGGFGMVGADQGVSLDQLVIDNEMMSYMTRVRKGFEINEETLALDLIKEIGIGGSFLGARHTLRHLRQEHWFPKIFNRDRWETWRMKGGKDTLDRAHVQLEKILKDHYPPEPMLDKDQIERLDCIYREAKRALIPKK